MPQKTNHFGSDLVLFDSLLQSTPLHLATKNSHVEIQKYLADHGADVSMKDGVSD